MLINKCMQMIGFLDKIDRLIILKLFTLNKLDKPYKWYIFILQ